MGTAASTLFKRVGVSDPLVLTLVGRVLVWSRSNFVATRASLVKAAVDKLDLSRRSCRPQDVRRLLLFAERRLPFFRRDV